MSTSSIQPPQSLQDLAASMMRRFDADGNGSLSSQEFGSLLTDLLGRLQTTPGVGTTSPGFTAASAAAAPEATATARSKVGYMGGFDLVKLNNVNHKTLKYEMGRIMQFYPNTPEGLRQALPELQQLVPGVKITGSKGDKLDFGEYVDPEAGRIGVIDVIQAAGLGGVSWQWHPVA